MELWHRRCQFQSQLSYTALSRLTTELSGFKSKKNFTNTTGFAGVEAYQFKKGSTFKYVVWSATFTPPPPPALYHPQCSWERTKKLATFMATSLRVVDYLGKTKTISDNSKKDKDPAVGKIAFKVKASPKIVQVNP